VGQANAAQAIAGSQTGKENLGIVARETGMLLVLLVSRGSSFGFERGIARTANVSVTNDGHCLMIWTRLSVPTPEKSGDSYASIAQCERSASLHDQHQEASLVSHSLRKYTVHSILVRLLLPASNGTSSAARVGGMAVPHCVHQSQDLVPPTRHARSLSLSLSLSLVADRRTMKWRCE